MLRTHPHKVAAHLTKKGWKKHHIATVIKHLEESKGKTSHRIKEKHVLFFALALILACNILVLAGIFPLFLGAPQWLLLSAVAIIGLSFGYLIDGVISEFEIGQKHYLMSGIIISGAATITMLAVIEIGNSILKPISIAIQINPLPVIFFYIASFSLPHLVNKIRYNKGHRA